MIMTLKFLLDEEYNKGKVYARKKKGKHQKGKKGEFNFCFFIFEK